MKALLKIVAFAMLLLLLTTSCMVISPNRRHDNGRHKGWFKKTKHHPKKLKRNNQSLIQTNGQENLFTVADYFNWIKENPLKRAQNAHRVEN